MFPYELRGCAWTDGTAHVMWYNVMLQCFSLEMVISMVRVMYGWTRLCYVCALACVCVCARAVCVCMCVRAHVCVWGRRERARSVSVCVRVRVRVRNHKQVSVR